MTTKTKTKAKPLSLAVPDEPENVDKREQVYAALGETPDERDKRHIQTMSAEVLIAQAIEKKVPVETMERLLLMRRELKAEWAKEQYDRAMAGFQSESPTIQKTRAVKTKSGAVAYRYAPIESIIEQVQPLLQKYSFSYSFTMELKVTGVRVVCHVTQAAGHTEDSPMEVPFGEKTQIMSNSHVAAAATTFAKRYALCNAFGILTGDEDTDAQPSPQTPQGRTPSKPTPKKSDKERIASYLEYLGIDWKNAEQAKAAIRSITQLDVTEANYPEIASRLSITVQERREAEAEAERLKKLNAAPPPQRGS